jgi:hypothetical protein
MVKNLILGVGISFLILFTMATDSCMAMPDSTVDSAKNSSTNLQIRTDGVYYLIISDEKNADGISQCDAVRFYDNNTCIEAEFYGIPTDLVKWFGIENEKILPGTWILNGNELITTISTGFRESTRTGTLAAEGWRISDKIVFQFVQLSFPKEPIETLKNHRPYFKGIGKYSHNFEYDEAGSLVGINTKLEVQAVDQDGDSLMFNWKASNGSPVGEGPKVIWKRMMQDGKPLPGEISVEVTDGKGGKISTSIEMK